MKNRLALTILIFLSPLLVGASCNLGTFVAKNTIGRIFSAEDYERGVDEIVVHRLLIAPLATLTPTPTPGGAAEDGESAGLPGGEGQPGASGGGGGGSGDIDDAVHATPTPTTTGLPSTTPTLPPTATASATSIPSPTMLLLTETPTALPTATATTVQPTATGLPTDEPPDDEPSNPTLPTNTPTATPTPTPTSLPVLSSSLKLSNPSGEVLPNGPGGNTPITYTIRVENTSAVTAASVTVRDTLPTTFTLDNTTIYGPSPTVSGNTIVWGPFDVLPNTNKLMGFKGVWPYNPPTGVRGQTETNTAEISAPWLTTSLNRSASVFILYPPDIVVITASFTPTTVLQTDSPAFAVDVANNGSAAVNIAAVSQLVLSNGGTNFLTANLDAATAVPADGQPYTLTFSPSSLALVPPGTYQADLYLSWLDENGITDGRIFTNTATVDILAPAAITAAATPDPSTAIMGGSNFPVRFWLWNEGNIPAQFYPGVDSIEIVGSTDWINFFAAGSYNFPCGNIGLWQGSNITIPPEVIVRYTPSTPTLSRVK